MNPDKTSSRLKPWMKFCLYFCAITDAVFGLTLITLFDLAYPWFGIGSETRPLPLQMLGIFYLVRGIVTGFAAIHPARHANQLFGVLLTRLGCFLFVGVYAALGQAAWVMLPIGVFIDFVFVFPLWIIYTNQRPQRKRKLDVAVSIRPNTDSAKTREP